MKIKAAIFDLDGTLVDSIRDIAASGNAVLAEQGLPQHTVEEYKYFLGDGVLKLVQRIFPGQDENKIQSMLERYKEIYAAHLYDTTAPYDGIMDMLGELKNRGVKLAVCSNKHHSAAVEIVAKMFPAGLFDAVCGVRPGIEPKPNPAGVLSVMAELGVKPAETVYMGDSGVDIETGLAAGAVTVGVLWGFRKIDELAAAGGKIFLSSPAELFEKVEL